jgi:hypothetical protein
MSEYEAVSVMTVSGFGAAVAGMDGVRMNSESRSVPGTTTPPSPMTWPLTTFSQVAPLCRRPK